MPTGPKFSDIPSTAGWLYVCGLCYCSHNLTDGFIPMSEVSKLSSESRRVVQRAVQWLCTVHPPATQPLWHDHPQGVLVHDYGDPTYGNRTRAVEDVLRESRAAAGRVGGLRSAQVRKERYGTAQPEAHPEAPRFEASRSTPLRAAQSAPKHAPNDSASNAFEAPYRTDPPRSEPYHPSPTPPPAAGDKATVILAGFLEASNKTSYSAVDAVKAQEYAGDFQHLTGEQIADLLREHAEWMASQKKRPYGKLEYYGEFLRQRHDRAADNGSRPARGSTGELTRLSDVRSVDPDDE